MFLLVIACSPPKPEPLDTSVVHDTADTDTVETGETGDTDTLVDTDTSGGTGVPETGDTGEPHDADGDGYDALVWGGGDCDDADPAVHPGAEDIVGNGLDDDCDGLRGPTTWAVWGPPDVDFGVPMSPGDVDGDGVADLAVGAGQAYDYAGAVYLFSGATLEDGITADQALAVFVGPDPGEDARTGSTSTGAIGDLDGDGVPELGYGAHYADVGDLSNTGAFYIWGGGRGLNGTFDSDDADLTLMDDDGAAEVGFAASGVGDLDGDGYADLAVGAPYGGTLWDGRVWVVSGSAVVTAAGLVDLNTVSAGAYVGTSYDCYGWATAGPVDLDDDGSLDLVASSHYSTVSTFGSVEVVYGPVAPTSTSDARETWIYGPETNAWYGEHLDAGDLDHDGYTDLVASAPGIGTVYVKYGDGTRWEGEQITTSTNVGAYTGALAAGLTVADLDGDTDDDLVVAGAADQTLYFVLGGSRASGDAAASAVWSSFERALTGSDLVALPDVPNVGRPAIAASGEDVVVLAVQVD